MSQHDLVLRQIDERITWILNHPGISLWLKTALETALDRDPIAVVNDLEVLNSLLRTRCDVMVSLPETRSARSGDEGR